MSASYAVGELATLVTPQGVVLAASDRLADLVPLGLLAGLFTDPGSDLARGLFLGRYGLTGLSNEDLAAWHDDSSGLVIGTLTDSERRAVLESAATHARELGIDDLAGRSELLPQGLTARLDALANAIEVALPGDPEFGPKQGGLDSVEWAWQQTLRHLSARTSSSYRAAEAAVRLLRWLGVAYLVYLGVRMWLKKPTALDAEATAAASPVRLFVQGFLTNVTNPKLLIFYGAFFPQFIDATLPLSPQLAILCVTFFVIAATFDTGYAFVGGRARLLFRSNAARRPARRAMRARPRDAEHAMTGRQWTRIVSV